MPAASPALGRRIAVVGTSGCGKTYVAEALARRLAIPYICNDAIIWRPGWQPAPYEERVAEIDEATNAAAWTFDGNLAARHLDDQIVLSRCDTLVWLRATPVRFRD
jgi:adenylate kinase family enzyme